MMAATRAGHGGVTLWWPGDRSLPVSMSRAGNVGCQGLIASTGAAQLLTARSSRLLTAVALPHDLWLVARAWRAQQVFGAQGTHSSHKLAA